MIRKAAIVALGGTIGTAARLGAGMLLPEPGGLPLATVTVNVVGALLIGMLTARLTRPSGWRLFLGAGVLGGFTTYSAFALGSVQLWTDAPLLAALYAFGSLVLGVAAAAAGMRIAAPRRRT